MEARRENESESRGGGAPKVLGRYEILGALARGGMATVYLGRHSGEAGFQRLYAIKVLHPHLADDDGFIEMMLDEARIAARLHHPNVVPIVDLGSSEGHHYVAMEYVEGCALSAMLGKHREERPPKLLVSIMLDALAGLHAAHALTDDDGTPLGLVHRDVSPQNILIGIDGSARITDFGVAKAKSQVHSTRPGELKGKLAFMSPEHFRDASKLDRRSDVFSAGAMFWSMLTGRRLFLGSSDAETLANILKMDVPAPSTVGLAPPAALDAVCLKALERDPEKRFASAAEMEDALREAATSAGILGSKREVAAWVDATFGEALAERRRVIRASGPRSSRDESSPSIVSGFRMIPSVGASSSTPAGRRSSIGRTSDPEIEPSAETLTLEHAPSGRGRRGLFAALGLGVVAIVGAGIYFARAKAELPAAEASPAAAQVATSEPTTTTEAKSAPEPKAAEPTPVVAKTVEPKPAEPKPAEPKPVVRSAPARAVWTPPPPPAAPPPAKPKPAPTTTVKKGGVPIVTDDF